MNQNTSTVTGNYIEFNPPLPCPSCGRCPTCGKGGHQTEPYWPLGPFYPTIPCHPTWYGTITSASSTVEINS